MSKRKSPAAERGFEIDVVVLKVERIANSRDGNPKYRLHADQGIYTTADDVQAGYTLTGDESGPMVLRVENGRVIGWRALPVTGR